MSPTQLRRHTLPQRAADRVAGPNSFRLLLAASVTPSSHSLDCQPRQLRPRSSTVIVQDSSARGAQGIVVIAEPDVAQPRSPSAVRTAVMDQRQMQFVPNVLVVQTGSAVDFPNSDQIEHQVYSFSPAKRFELSLYAGHKYPPVLFDRAGLVVLGCNIHDTMIGYIYVTDSPFFGRTDVAGRLQLHKLPAGGYTLLVWHPGMQERGGSPLRRHVTLAANAQASEEFALTHALHRDMGGSMGSMRWAED